MILLRNSHHDVLQWVGGRDGGRQESREGWREGGRESGREEWREGGREGGMKGRSKGEREGGRRGNLSQDFLHSQLISSGHFSSHFFFFLVDIEKKKFDRRLQE